MADQLGTYVDRILEDDYVRKQIRDAVTRSRRASVRARNQRTARAVRDEKLLAHLTGAAGSLQEAIRTLANPRRRPKRRRLRTAKLLTLAMAAGAAAAYFDRTQGRRRDAYGTTVNGAGRGYESPQPAAQPLGGASGTLT
jgi:ferric-dicitrate binding protein FerR (iron transport regulator)